MIWFLNKRSGQRFCADEHWAQFHAEHPDCEEIVPAAIAAGADAARKAFDEIDNAIEAAVAARASKTQRKRKP